MHITQRDSGSWYFQRRIPAISQPFFSGKKYIKQSLKTKNKVEARQLARQLSADLDIQFEKHKALAMQKELSVDNALSGQSAMYAQHAHLEKLQSLGKTSALEYLANKSEQLPDVSESDMRYLHSVAFHEGLTKHVDLVYKITHEDVCDYELQQQHEWRVFEGQLSDKQFSHYQSFNNTDKRTLYIEFVKNLSSNTKEFDDKIFNPLSVVSFKHDDLPKPVEQPHDASSSNLLSDRIDEYLESRKLDDIKEKTFLRYQARMKLLLDIVGNHNVRALNRQDALQFRTKLLALPANMNKVAKYRELTIDEIIQLKPEPMSRTTANDTFTDVSKFFSWCVLNDYADKNSFEELKVKVKKKDADYRSHFDNDDLTTLFSDPIYQGQKPKHPHYYWLPLLALFTGARMNELCQLYVDDVRQDNSGIWTLRFTDAREDQQLKNSSSRRTIPLHSKLIELGFVDYVKGVGHERVFPELKKQRDGYQQAASKWFARFRDKVLPDAKEQNKTFHSFRHTVANTLKQQGHNKSPVSAILGHGEDNETFGRYGKAYVMDVLQPVVESLTFDVNVSSW